MTTITIQFNRSRGTRFAILAMSIGVSLIVWAEQRSHPFVDHDEQSRRIGVARGIQAREHAALRLASLR